MSTLTINAWIDRKDPIICLSSGITGKLIARWHSQSARQLFEDGVLTLKELFSNNKQLQQQAAHELLLIACADSLCNEQGKKCFTCITSLLLKSYIQNNQLATNQKERQGSIQYSPFATG
ncbi:MAG: hypothetical protein V7731_10060 [Amphritea sp.]